jgi:hypothetical protein
VIDRLTLISKSNQYIDTLAHDTLILSQTISSKLYWFLASNPDNAPYVLTQNIATSSFYLEVTGYLVFRKLTASS